MFFVVLISLFLSTPGYVHAANQRSGYIARHCNWLLNGGFGENPDWAYFQKEHISDELKKTILAKSPKLNPNADARIPVLRMEKRIFYRGQDNVPSNGPGSVGGWSKQDNYLFSDAELELFKEHFWNAMKMLDDAGFGELKDRVQTQDVEIEVVYSGDKKRINESIHVDGNVKGKLTSAVKGEGTTLYSGLGGNLRLRTHEGSSVYFSGNITYHSSPPQGTGDRVTLFIIFR